MCKKSFLKKKINYVMLTTSLSKVKVNKVKKQDLNDMETKTIQQKFFLCDSCTDEYFDGLLKASKIK
jgi:hypothetical protein